MQEVGYKSLAAAIIVQAYKDMKEAHGEIIRVRKACARGNLSGYLENKKRAELEADHRTALEFFRGAWCKNLISALDIVRLPANVEDMVNAADGYFRYCHRCIEREKRKIARRLKDKKEGIIIGNSND